MKPFLKIVLWIVLVLTVACSLGLFLFWKFFPEKKIIALVERQSESAGMPVRIQSIGWTLPAQFEIRQIRVHGAAWQTPDSEPFFTLNRLSTKCKLLPLLRRRLEIAEVQMDEPRVVLDSAFFNMPPKSRTEKPAGALKPLPLSFRLLHFGLDRFRLRMKLPAKQGGTDLVLDGLNLDVSGIRVPRKWAESPGGVRGAIRVFTDRATLWIRSAGMEFRLTPEINIEFKWLKDKHWKLQAKAGILTEKQADPKGVFFNAILDGTGYGDSVYVRQSALSLGNETLVRFTGQAFRTKKTMEFWIRALGRSCDLSVLKQTAESLLPDSLAHSLARFNVDGSLNILNGEIQGNVSEFQFRFASMLKDASFRSEAPPITIQNGNVSVFLLGMWKTDGFENAGMTGNGTIGRITMHMNDTTSFSMRDLSVDWNVNADSRLMPKKGRLSGSVADLLNGRVLFHLGMNAGNGEVFRPEDILLDGTVKMDSMDMACLPNAPAGLGGKVNGLVQLKADGLKDIRLAAVFQTPGVRYLFQEKSETTPPLSLHADVFCRTQKPFQTWVMDSAVVRSGNLLFARASGRVHLKQPTFDFSIAQAKLRNGALVPFLPKPLMEQMKGLKLSGEESLALRLRGSGSGKNLRVSAEGMLTIDKAGMALPEQAIGVEGIHGEVAVAGTLETLQGNGSMVVPNIFLDQIRSAPLKDSRIRFHLTVKAPDSIRIDNGVLEIPSLLTDGKFRFELGPMSGSPRMALSLEAGLKSPGRLEVMRGLSLSGNALGRLQLTTLDPIHRQFRILGLVQSDSLSVFQQNQVEVKNIFCSLPFQMDVDMLKKRLLKTDETKPLFWVEYEANRERLRHAGAPLENVRIEKVVVLDYQIGNILLDVRIRDGWIAIPWFSASLLSGNVGGNLWFDTKTGLPQDMMYSIRAQASRINSAQLKGLGIQTGEETELDATLAFTGKGIDVNQGLDLDGSFHITQIGPRFAITLLEQMDPKGNDRSIRLTRRLLNAGWKPKLLSFELRHGYVYPSLVLAQPWFSPLRIPDKVEYGRLPLEFLIKQKSMFQMN